MAKLTASSVSAPDTTEEDPRVGHYLASQDVDVTHATAVLVGFPVDEGVARNGGRPGAAEAPDRLRSSLYRMTPDARRHGPLLEFLRHSVDLGNISENASLADLQTALGDLLASHLQEERIPIILGGGHETAYGHFLGYVAAEQEVSILNWDAHPDVRPLDDGRPHSGSPFRQALEHRSGRCRQYTVAGLLPHSAARAHLEFIDDHGGRYLWSNDLSRDAVLSLYENATAPLLVTFDLDAVDQTEAPGVSAPAVDGLSKDLWLQAAYQAGRCPKVTSIDLVECNPRVDVDDQTARLAALTVMQILRGLTDRIYRT